MPLVFDPAVDHEVFDGTETVTFRSVVNGAVASAISVAAALRRVLGKRAAQLTALGLALEPQDLVWHLPNTNLAGVAPKPGDEILDSTGAVFHVLAIDRATLGTRWACVTRRQPA